MGKEIKLDTDKKLVLVTEKGIASFRMDPDETMGLLLAAFLDMWDEHHNSIDVMDACEQIMELLSNMDPDECDDGDDIDELIRKLLGEEDDD